MTVRATVRNGHLEFAEPLDLPDGYEVDVTIRAMDDDEPMSQEEIDHVLAIMDRMQPLKMSEEEIAAWEAERAAHREAEKARFFEDAHKRGGEWS